MQHSAYALYGITEGIMVNDCDVLLNCGVISDGWPSWGFGAEARGLNVSVIVIKNNEWEGLIRRWFPKAAIMVYDEEFQWNPAMSLVQVWMSDINLPSKLNHLFTEAKLVILRRRARQVPPATWTMHAFTVTHAECGGVTDGKWVLFVYAKDAPNLPDTLQFMSTSHRNLRSVLDSMSPGRPCSEPPKLASTTPLGLVKLRGTSFHCDGLFPWQDRLSFVFCPSIFSPTKWVRRHLTGGEMMRVLDIPDHVTLELSSSQRASLCQNCSLLPMKVVIRLLDTIPLGQLADVSSKKSKLDSLPSGLSLSNVPTRRMNVPSTPLNIASDDETVIATNCSNMPSTPLDIASDDETVIATNCSNTEPLGHSLVVDTPAEPFANSLPTVLDPSTIAGVEAKRNLKATKADDAPVPEYLWDHEIVTPDNPHYVNIIRALTCFRRLVLRRWKWNLLHEFMAWFRKQHGTAARTPAASRDFFAGRDCIVRAWNSTWWAWTDGSRPFFWRWPSEYQTVIRDGHALWLRGALPQWRLKQRSELDHKIWAAIRIKLFLVRARRYVHPGEVRSLTSFFAVPKGEDDIRMVYDGTKSGLNDVLWAPWFPLPTIEMHLRSVGPGSFMGDIDIGDMFLNFMLHERIQPYAGVDLTPFFPEELSSGTRQVLWERWGRCAMGFKTSPYQAVQGILFAEEIIRGDPFDPTNIFRWDLIVLNLPGSPAYDPSKAWVFKWRVRDGLLACDLIIYVDDVRTMGNSFVECKAASRRAASFLNSLGIQDAPRKRRDPSMTPGAWSGSICLCDTNTVDLVVAQERWDKAKRMILWMKEAIQSGPEIEFKTLESHRGFLIYLVRTYPAINPYLKGIHLSLDSWRPWRKEDGWKLTLAEIRVALQEKGIEMGDPTASASTSHAKAPRSVRWVPRFPSDIDALWELFNSDKPPRRQVRPAQTATAIYQFGDASGSGFGSSLIIGDKVYYSHGQWDADHSKESSNFRELANLIYAIEGAHKKGLLEDAELFFFTDNSTAESVFYKGTSTSEKLFNLVLRLRKLQLHGCLILHVIHVAGKRMMAQGTDGLSRGITTVGIMEGQSFSFFVPLHLNAAERQGASFRHWIHGWLGNDCAWLEPRDWFTKGHTQKCNVWCPPPAAADAALEQLGQAIHKRPYNTHVVVIPRLMTSRWRKLLGKICDLVFTVPLGTEAWSDSQFEPLVVGIYFPLCRHNPWRLRRTPILERAERDLRDLPHTTIGWGGIVLRELFRQTRALDSMSSSMVRPLLRSK